MLVKDWMSTNVITVEAHASLSQAMELMEIHRISMLPVVRQGKLVGMLTDLDLRPIASPLPTSAAVPDFSVILSRIKIEEVMSRAPVTISSDFTVEEAADVLLKNEISGVAVTDRQSQVVGVFTQTDINRVLVSVTGLWKGGIVFGFLQEDHPGSIKELTDTLRLYGGRLACILTSYERVAKGYRKVHIRVRGLDRSKLSQLKEELKNKATLLYAIDQRENTREICVQNKE